MPLRDPKRIGDPNEMLVGANSNTCPVEGLNENTHPRYARTTDLVHVWQWSYSDISCIL